MAFTAITRLNSFINSAIPYAWDDSESWFEFLAKVLAKVNELIDKSNDYFSVDLQTYVTEILTAWQADGTLTEILSPLVDMALRNPIHVKSFGAVGDGVANDTLAIQAAIDFVVAEEPIREKRREISISNGQYVVDGINITAPVVIKGRGHLVTSPFATYCLKLSNVLYGVFEDIFISLSAAGQTAIIIESLEGASDSQLNTFNNIQVEGNGHAFTTCLDIGRAYVNSFTDCKFFRTANGVIFSQPSANANFFTGCEIRANPNSPINQTGIVHKYGEVNVFQSCVIENHKNCVDISGGYLILDGCYTEGFQSGRPFIMSGDAKLVIKNTLVKGLVEIKGGKMLIIEGCDLESITGTNAGYPYIRFTGDYGTEIIMRANRISDSFVHCSYGKYYDNVNIPSPYLANRSPANIKEQYLDRGQVCYGSFNSTTGVTGDGTNHTLLMTSTINPYGEIVDASGQLNPKDGGFYEAQISVRLAGVDDTNTYGVLTAFRAGANYSVKNLQVLNAATKLTSGELNFYGTVLLDGIPNAPWVFRVSISGGSAKNVNVGSGSFVIKRIA